MYPAPYVAALAVIGSLHLQMAGAFVLQQPRPDRKALLNFFQFVMANDERWWFVIDQPVSCKPTDLSPPYQNRKLRTDTMELIRLLDDDAEYVVPRKLLRTVIDHYWWLGSYVDYAARVLSTALQCITFVNVILVIEKFMEFEFIQKGDNESTTYPDNDPIADAAVDVVAAISVFAEKLAASRSDASVLAELLVLYMDRVRHRVDRSGGNDPEIDVMEDVLLTRCLADESMYYSVMQRMGLHFTNIRDDRKHLSEQQAQENLDYSNARMVVESMIYHYEQLHVGLFPRDTWLQIIGYPDHFGTEITDPRYDERKPKV